jgi:polyphosphate kinase
MERNLNRRVEVLCPVRDPDQRRLLRHVVLAAYLKDNSRAHVLQPDGTYLALSPHAGEAAFNAQDFLLGQPLVPHGNPENGYELDSLREDRR